MNSDNSVSSHLGAEILLTRSADDVGIGSLSRSQIIECLQSLPRQSVVALFSRMSCRFAADRNRIDLDNYWRLAGPFYGRKTIRNFQDFRDDGVATSLPFHVPEIRMLLKLALLHCSPVTSDRQCTTEDLRTLGQILCSFRQAFPATPLERSDADNQLYLYLKMTKEMKRFRPAAFEFMALKERLVQDLFSADEAAEAVFTEEYGADPSTYQTILILIWTYFSQVSYTEVSSSPFARMPIAEFFGIARISAPQVQSVLNDCAWDMSCELTEQNLGSENKLHDFSGFARKPLAIFPDGSLACLDLEFLEGLLVRKVYQLTDRLF